MPRADSLRRRGNAAKGFQFPSRIHRAPTSFSERFRRPGVGHLPTDRRCRWDLDPPCWRYRTTPAPVLEGQPARAFPSSLKMGYSHPLATSYPMANQYLPLPRCACMKGDDSLPLPLPRPFRPLARFLAILSPKKRGGRTRATTAFPPIFSTLSDQGEQRTSCYARARLIGRNRYRFLLCFLPRPRLRRAICAPFVRLPRCTAVPPTTALACRTALPSEAPRARALLATCRHCLFFFGVFAFLVCRRASLDFHGMG